MHTPAQQQSFDTVMAVIRLTTVLLGVYWLAIFVATHLPGSAMPPMGSGKIQHLIAFAGLGLLLSRAVSLCIRDVRAQVTLVLLIALLYAMFDEWSQRFVAGRQPDVEDILADGCGALLGMACFWILRAVFILARETRLAKQPS